MPRGRKKNNDIDINKVLDVEAYMHENKKRTNNPMATMALYDHKEDALTTYVFGSHIDPSLEWVEKKERLSFNMPIGRINELCVPELAIHVDSNTIDDTLREMVGTVGQRGKPGERIRNMISVGMLSEGWYAKTVTHIIRLRAFSSQLLCEQAVGRGLRRTSYDVNENNGFFTAEHMNIFGIPFTFLPHEAEESLILETKGQETHRDIEKRKALTEWIDAVNRLGEYGEWCHDVSNSVTDVDKIIAKHATAEGV